MHKSCYHAGLMHESCCSRIAPATQRAVSELELVQASVPQILFLSSKAPSLDMFLNTRRKNKEEDHVRSSVPLILFFILLVFGSTSRPASRKPRSWATRQLTGGLRPRARPCLCRISWPWRSSSESIYEPRPLEHQSLLAISVVAYPAQFEDFFGVAFVPCIH